MIPKWLVHSMFTILLWGVWGFLGKLAGNQLTSAESQAFSTLGLLPVLVFLLLRKPARGPRLLRGLVCGFVSGLLVGSGNLAYYHALAVGGAVSSVTPLTALYPVVTILLAVVFLRERISVVQAGGIALALASIALFNPPAAAEGGASLWLAYALVPVGLWGTGGLLQKISTDDISSELTTVAFLSAFLPIAAAILLTQPLRWTHSTGTWIQAVLLGVLFGVGNLTLLVAFGSGGKASVVTPLTGLYSIVTIPLALLFLEERIAWREGLGIALALAAVIALSQERSTEPAVKPC